MAEISKEELMAFVEVQEKNVQQMEKIATSLTAIAEGQKEILNALKNGITDKIVSRMKESCKVCQKDSSIASQNSKTILIIIGSMSIVTFIAYVVLKLIGHI